MNAGRADGIMDVWDRKGAEAGEGSKGFCGFFGGWGSCGGPICASLGRQLGGWRTRRRGSSVVRGRREKAVDGRMVERYGRGERRVRAHTRSRAGQRKRAGCALIANVLPEGDKRGVTWQNVLLNDEDNGNRGAQSGGAASGKGQYKRTSGGRENSGGSASGSASSKASGHESPGAAN